MKKVGKILLWIFAVFGFLLFLTIIILATSFPSQKKVDIKPGSWLELSLEGTHHDYNLYQDLFFLQEDASISELCRKIDQAKNDKRITGILLKPKIFRTGWAFTQELHQHLLNFKKAGKKIVSYIDLTSDKGYYLASVSDKIYLNPSASAGIALTGLGLELNYYKGFLDKIGIEFTVLHQGKYKSAGETFARENMSQPTRESLSKLIEDIYFDYTKRIASARNISKEDFNQIMQEREQILISAKPAVSYGLVDDLVEQNEINKKILSDAPIFDFSDYRLKAGGVLAHKIAVIYAQGNIVQRERSGFMNSDYRSITEKKIFKQLDIIDKMESVKAVVLRVNSGGGSALVSENILKRLEKLSKRIPLVISMGNVAASGGYMISCQADYIVAQPTSITGSIGVVAMLPNWQKLREKADINTHTIQKGKFAGFLSPNFAPSPAEISALDMELKEIYASFKHMVGVGRDMSEQKVETIAQGRVWSGLDALRLGLIDEVGGLDIAVQKAAELAEISQYSRLILPQKKTLLDLILAGNGPFQIIEQLNIFTSRSSPFLQEINEKKSLILNFLEDPLQMIIPYELELN